MEFKLALNYLGLTVKRKLSKILEKWKNHTLVYKAKVRPFYKKNLKLNLKRNLRTESEQISLSEPSPVSTKILKKNKLCLENSSRFNTLWPLCKEKVKSKPIPIKLYQYNTSVRSITIKRVKAKENEEIAVVSTKSFFVRN